MTSPTSSVGFGTSPFGTAPFGGAAPMPALPPIGLPDQPRWSWAFGAWNALPTGELVHATSRSLKLRLTGTSEASFTLDGAVAEAGQIQELVTDLWAMRNGFTLFRGRTGGTQHAADGTRHTIQVSAGDYRGLLQRRLLFDADPLTYTATEQAAIAAGLLAATQAQVGGSLNITDGSTPTGTARTITYPAGQSVGQAIEQLSLMDSGFNWDIVPATGQVGQAFTVWPSRGNSTQRVVDYPGQIASFSRPVDPGTYANAIRETGNTGLAAVRVEAPDLATRPEGRWDAQLGDTSLLDAASVAARAGNDLAARQEITPTWTVKLKSGAWGGPPDIWLGDTVLLSAVSGPLQVLDELRVFEIDIDVDDNDQESVSLVLSALDPFKRARARQFEYRLTNLERR